MHEYKNYTMLPLKGVAAGWTVMSESTAELSPLRVFTFCEFNNESIPPYTRFRRRLPPVIGGITGSELYS